MPFPLHPDPIPLSYKDILSYVFDDPTYPVDKPVLIDPENPKEKYFSHARAQVVVRHLISGFQASGLRRGETVCLHGFNSIWYPLLVLGVIGAGGVCVGTNPGYTSAELRHALQIAKVKYVLSELGQVLSNIIQAMAVIGVDVRTSLWVLDLEDDATDPSWMSDGSGHGLDYEGMIASLSLPSTLIDDKKEGVSKLRSWRRLVRHGTKDWDRFDDKERSAKTVAQLYYTSGTTGLPKCAMTSHLNMVAQHQIYFEAQSKPWPFKLMLCLPCFHIGASGQYIISALKQGRDAYVMRRFELEPFLRYNNKYQCTEVFLVPPMFNAIVMSGLADPKSPNYRAEYNLRSVRNGTTGAAPCSANLQARFNALLGDGATYTQVWGMTETTCLAMAVPRDIALDCSSGKLNVWGTVGKPLSHISIKLTDESGNDVTRSLKRGQLCVRGPTVVSGYFENETATKQSWDDEGYLLTGDIAILDEHGLLYIVERLKELIKVRGFQCAPAELEGALTEHPDIVDAAVIGIKVTSPSKDETEAEEEEAPKAFIVKRPGSSLSIEIVHSHMKQRLTRYKQLTGGVEFVETIPKLPSGKILKRVLREQEDRKRKKGRNMSRL